jgi:hypothetical protein
MKFTRIYILKAISLANDKNVEINQNATAVEVFKEVVLAHPNIDMILSLVLSIMLFLTKTHEDVLFVQTYSINFYFITKVNITCLVYYLFTEYLCSINTTYSSNKALEIVNRYFHTFKSFAYLFKNILCIISYFLSILFCYIYGDQRLKLDIGVHFFFHLLFLEFFQFYCAFRFCYFLVKIIINIFLLPVYLSSLYLGFVEDKFNNRLNNIINTKSYTGRLSLRSSTEDYCSICLAVFQYDEIVSTLPCSRRHTFHTKCLEKWFRNTVCCPLCRSDFHNNTEMNIFNNQVIRNSSDNELNQQLLN